jgi:serine/threonine protein kinase
MNYEIQIQPWLDEGMTEDVLRQARIGYYPGADQITIPHFDMVGRFVGLRGRAMAQDDVDRWGKYRPLRLNKTTQFNKFIKKIDKINPNNYLRYQLEYEVIELLSEEEPLSFYSVKHKSSGSILKEKTISKLKYQENELGLEKYVLNYLKQHPHKNIVNIRDIYESVDNLHIIFEHQQKKSANIDIYTFLYDLLQGLHYLHSNGIVHRNISIENVIHDTQNGCCFKISNFSLSRTFFPSETFKDDLPFGVFSAPEVIEGKKYNSSCDIWSYGIVCFCILEGRIPFKEGKKDEMINNINDFLSKVLVKHIDDWKKRNKVYDKILSKTLIKSMFARPTTNDLLKMFQ